MHIHHTHLRGFFHFADGPALEKALECGPEPLIEEANFRRATETLNLLSEQLAHFEIVCDEPDARVNMDGRLLFVGPGRYMAAVDRDRGL